ncbi:helix-turn-helix transcriptional regulator [bacterium]|nr:helix-turn-helix transcriptional regulator [bacterium]
MIFEDRVYIGNKIRVARRERIFTQEKLAELAGITSKQLSRIETGEYMPSLPTFFKLISALELDISEFGLSHKQKLSRIQEKFIKLINSTSEKELEYCYNVLETILENIKLISN